MMKKLIYVAVAFIALFIIALNAGMMADQAVAWVNAHPKDPNAPDVLYKAGRWCDLMGSNDKAVEIYWMLYQQYPERGDLCAPALYYAAYIKGNSSYIAALRQQANQYLQIIMDQYSNQGDWGTKAKKLYDEVNYVH